MIGRIFLAIVIASGAHPLAAQSGEEAEGSAFHPPQAVSVTDITVPVAGEGTVVLDVLLDERGDVQRIEVRRDIDKLTPLALQAVGQWKFSSATLGGKPVPSRMPVALTFRPPGNAAPVPLPTLIPQTDAAIQSPFQPAEVTRAEFPRYPDITVVEGAVVLEVTLNEKGEAGANVRVLRDLPPLTDEAKAVVGGFRFIAATFNGRPIPSKIILAFVSQPVSSPLGVNP